MEEFFSRLDIEGKLENINENCNDYTKYTIEAWKTLLSFSPQVGKLWDATPEERTLRHRERERERETERARCIEIDCNEDDRVQLDS
jgi:hypothetical protein